MPWQVEFQAGVWLPQIGWWLDPHFPHPRAFVSHAHSDHIAPHAEILCSPGTARLLAARLAPDVTRPRTEHVLPFGRAEQLTADCAVTLHPAGHIFGSAQCLLNHDTHGTLLYTGDFKLRPGRSAEKCATPAADTLIMETTFGRPHYVFPPANQVLTDIAAFCHACIDDHEVPVLFGYSLGKSQELLCCLAEAKLPVMLHREPLRLTRIYAELGIPLPPYREFDASEAAGHVVICPPQGNNSSFLKLIPRRRTAIVTGWAMDPGAIYRYQCDAAFPLSDHADYPDLLRFVEAVNPGRVLTLHGFAQEFAQTLRDRGVEAWAISEDNQLELGIGSAGVPPAFLSDGGRDARAPAPGPHLSSLAAQPHAPGAGSAFSRFAAVAEQVRATPRKLEKIEHLRAYLAELPPADAALAALFFTARPFPQADGRVLTMGWAVIKRAVLAVAGTTEADYRAAYRRFADAGDAAEAMLSRRAALQPAPSPSAPPQSECHVIRDISPDAHAPAGVSLAAVATAFADIAAVRGPAAKLARFEALLRHLSPVEAKYLVKIVTGDLRIGLKEGLVEEAIAAASGQPTEAVREANMLSGDIAEVTRAARENRLGEIQLRVFNPLQFMLASPEPTAEAILERFRERTVAPAGGAVLSADASAIAERPDSAATRPEAGTASSAAFESGHDAPPTVAPTPVTVWLEEKYDGIRCQIHKRNARVELFSRDLKRITDQFPDLARAAEAIPADFIGDGELLAWRDGRALPFAELQKRLGRKGDDFFLGAEIPVSISLYDLLWLDGRTLLKEPLATRRALLQELLSSLDPQLSTRFPLAPVQQAATATEIEAAFLAARQRGNEGLMAKDPASPYTPGRRGLAWLKLKKAYATLDVVVVAVEYGHGKRRDVLSDYTFAIRDEENDNRLLTVGKAYSGLTDAEIAQLTAHFLAHTLEDFGRYRTVVPDTVLEIAFDTIQPSNRHQSGFALRFPRIARIRTDKTPADIDTLETCRRLASAAAGAGFSPPASAEAKAG